MSYYDPHWLCEKYKKIYENTTGATLTTEENRSLKDFFNTYNDSLGKEIYYIAILRLKRGWFVFLVYLLISHKLKRSFIQNENLKTFIPLTKVFAKHMLQDAIKAYCKIND